MADMIPKETHEAILSVLKADYNAKLSEYKCRLAGDLAIDYGDYLDAVDIEIEEDNIIARNLRDSLRHVFKVLNKAGLEIKRR
jgi:hypothetical protein